MSTEWDHYLIHCYNEANRSSTDPSTQNAACIVPVGQHRELGTIVLGANHFPRGVAETEKRWERPGKYFFVEHAERNAIYEAASMGESTYGATMVSPWAACTSCARAIIQSGIVRLVRHRSKEAHAHWNEEIEIGNLMMQEAGIEIVEIDPIAGYKLRRDGVLVDTGSL